jgi:hypothetical protein
LETVISMRTSKKCQFTSVISVDKDTKISSVNDSSFLILWYE